MDIKTVAIVILIIAVSVLLKFYCSSIKEINHITDLYNLALKTAKEYRKLKYEDMKEIARLNNSLNFYQSIYATSENTRKKLKKELDEIKRGL